MNGIVFVCCGWQTEKTESEPRLSPPDCLCMLWMANGAPASLAEHPVEIVFVCCGWQTFYRLPVFINKFKKQLSLYVVDGKPLMRFCMMLSDFFVLVLSLYVVDGKLMLIFEAFSLDLLLSLYVVDGKPGFSVSAETKSSEKLSLYVVDGKPVAVTV